MAESENIVAETAEKIFSDLADAQTINRDKNGEWKAPLWQALTENGLPLSWVPEDCGGSGASLAEGFGVLSAAGQGAIGVEGNAVLRTCRRDRHRAFGGGDFGLRQQPSRQHGFRQRHRDRKPPGSAQHAKTFGEARAGTAAIFRYP